MRRIIAAVFSVLALAVVAIAAVPFLVPADWIRDRVVAEVEAATGLKLALDGPVSLGLFPSLALEAEDVGLSIGGGAPEFARVREIRFGLALGPLLDKHTEVTELALVSPRVVLSVDADGRANWRPAAADGTAPETPAADAPGGSADPVLAVSVERLTVEDGELVWSDDRTGTSETVTGIDLSTAITALDAPLTVEGGFTLRGVDQEIALTLDTPLALVRDGKARADLAVSSAVAGLSATGEIATGGELLFSGPMSLEVPEVAALAEALGGAADVPVSKFAAKGKVSVGSGRVDLADLVVQVDDLAGSGAVSLAAGDGVPRVDARLAFDRVALDVIAEKAAAGGSGSGGGDGKPAPLDLSPLAAFDAGLDLTVGGLDAAALQGIGGVSDLHLVAVIEKGALTAFVDRAKIGSGSVKARLKLGPDDERVRAEGSLEAAGLDVARLAGLSGEVSPLTGALGAKLRFSSSGRTLAALAAGLDVAGDVALSKGKLTGLGLAEAFGDPAAEALTGISATATVTSLASPLRIIGKAAFRKEPYAFDVSIDPRRLVDGGGFPLTASAKSKRLGIAFEGDVLPGARSVDGRVSLRAPSLGAAMAVLGRPGEGLPDGEVRVAGRLEAGPERVRFEDASFSLGETRFGGDVDVSLGDRPSVRARFDGDTVDLGVLVGGAAGTGAPGAPTAASAEGWSDAPLDLSGLTRFDADVTVAADRLRFGEILAGPAEVSLDLDDGVLTADLPKLPVFRGTGKGRIELDTAGEVPGVSASLAFDEVDILPLLSATTGLERIGGVADVSVDVKGAGASPLRLVRSLAGDASLEVRDGVLRGIDLPDLLRTVATAVVKGFGADGGAVTPFERLAATFRIEKGVAVNDDLVLASPVVEATGAGRFDLGAKTVAYRVTPTLVAPPGVGADDLAFEVPVVIEGPWAAPRIYPDIAGILENPAAAYEKLERLGGIFGKLATVKPGNGNLGAVLDEIAPGLGSVATGELRGPHGEARDPVAGVVGAVVGATRPRQGEDRPADPLDALLDGMLGGGQPAQPGAPQTAAVDPGAVEPEPGAGVGAPSDAPIEPPAGEGEAAAPALVPLPKPRPGRRAAAVEQPPAEPADGAPPQTPPAALDDTSAGPGDAASPKPPEPAAEPAPVATAGPAEAPAEAPSGQPAASAPAEPEADPLKQLLDGVLGQ